MRQLIAQKGDLRSLEREIGARDAHRHSDIRGGQRGPVVDPVTDERDPVPLTLKLGDDRRLLSGQDLGMHIVDRQLRS